jgi:RNA polymerase sigma-70 factor (ECF subfamily)
VAVAEVHGPAAALAVIENLRLERYHLSHAIRADLLRRLERYDDAAAAYETALERTGNAAERRFLKRRLAQVRADHNC